MKAFPVRTRILVVEDNPPIRLLLRRMLGAQFDVELAQSVDGALARATREHFDLFLLDINLGEHRTGVDLLGLLRQMPAYGTTPAVACTAFAGEDYREEFLARGFDVYVDKPFSRPRLYNAIEEALGHGTGWGNA